MTIEQIEKRLDNALMNGTEADVNYWRGYRDAVKAMQKEEPNEPLTLEELRRMKGEPVWLKEGLKVGEWAIALGREDLHCMYFTAWRGSMRFPIEGCGTVWLAYRRPPKED